MNRSGPPSSYTLNILFTNLRTKLHAKCNAILQQRAVGSFASSTTHGRKSMNGR